MKYFLDTYALIEIAEGNKNYNRYLDMEVTTLKDNLAEMFYAILKKYDEKAAMFFLDKFSRIAVELPVPIISKAMLFRHAYKKSKFSYVDCLGYSYALENKMIFVTGDRAFKGMNGVDFVK